ncbi:3-deoxy-manno-octulosonate cytidylyltransferase [bacterium]|nr:3-deoxy-manno-octulosonate cytidylyltransferase [bacterium]MBU1153746.1 3-deoxy-manno-octulosonate cytidylyltransferase [bacterium]MBU2600377.1 3-deoxy-manno-octulosonate cytidylyltransferase [bacterium]
MKVVGIIPARYNSTRFPGKPIVDLLGKPMIQHVYENALKASLLDELIIATDDQRILEVAKNFTEKVVLTSYQHKSGTDRIAEVIKDLDFEIVVNIQGDEPLISPLAINEVVNPFFNYQDLKMTTLKCPIKNQEELINPNIVKVVTNKGDYALYFSRSIIPYQFPSHPLGVNYYKHLGLYAYRKKFLLELTNLPPSKLEEDEKLEQLRVLENGYSMLVIETKYESLSVDIPEDLPKIVARLRRGNG